LILVRSDAARCANACSAAAWRWRGIAGYTDFTAGAERPDIPLLEMQVLYVQECSRLAQDLGGSVVRIFTGYERPELSTGQSWARCVQAVKDCARRAADFGVTVAVQNHHDVAVHYEALRDFLSEVDEPNVGAGYDAWAPTLQGLTSEQLTLAMRTLGPSIEQTIVADYVAPSALPVPAWPDELSRRTRRSAGGAGG